MRRIVIIQIMVLCYLYSNSRITVSDNYLLSPNAVGLGEYGEVPVSLHSGIPQIEIPIYEISYNSMPPIEYDMNSPEGMLDEITIIGVK